MTQTERRTSGQRQTTRIGSILTLIFVVAVLLARNYLSSGSDLTPVDQPQATAVQIVIGDGDAQKSDLPPLSSVGAEEEKKKATRTPTPKPRATRSPTRVAKATATAKRAPPTATAKPKVVKSQSGLPVILFEDLPREAQQTIRLIDKGGPFPYSRDGIEFQNRERLLPRESRGYYSEYTVITPGSRDRGARRIVAGENGELYYTDDHYDSFKEVVR